VESGDITRELIALREGESRGAMDRLFEMVYARLQRMARGRLGRGGPRITLDTTGLVHEAYLKFADQRLTDLRDRNHFFAVAARAMRQILVDHLRSRQAEKRGGGVDHAPLDESRIGFGDRVVELIELDSALSDLAELDERLCRVVEMKFFAGLSFAEIASVLEVTERTVQRDWRKARAFLFDTLRPAP